MKRLARVAMLTCVTTCSVSVVLAPVRVAAGTMTGGATEWTQITNYVTLCMGLIQQIQQVVSLASTVKSWGTTLKNIDSPQDVMNAVSGIKGIIARTRSIAFQGASLAARGGGMTERWKAAHPGEVDPASIYAAPSSSSGSPTALGSASGPDGSPTPADMAAFSKVDESLQAAVQRAYTVLDLHAEEADNDEIIFEKLSTKMQTVTGARQVGMMTNELLLEMLHVQMRLGEKLDQLAYISGEYASAEAQKSQYGRSIRGRHGRYTGRFRGDQVGAGDWE